MSPRARLEAAARLLDPDRQGQLDGLCGIYATINAVRIALYPAVELKRCQRRRLFVTAVEVLHKVELLDDAVHDGMTAATLRKVAAAVAATAGDMTGLSLTLSRIVAQADRQSRWRVLRAIRRRLRAGEPVILTLWGCYDHHTVVTGFSKTRLHLYDSNGRRWVAIRSIAVADDDPGRHRITARDVMAVSAVT